MIEFLFIFQFLFMVFIGKKVEKLIEQMRIENPDVIESYGNPSSSLHVYFSFSFLTMGGFENENISPELKKRSKQLQHLEIYWLLSLILLISLNVFV